MHTPLRITVSSQSDVEQVRREARMLAAALGFDHTTAETVALAVSELATNLVHYAQRGAVTLSRIEGPRGVGVQVESRDEGPGILDLSRAMRNGFSTGGGLGGGLGAVRRLMDDFEIATGPEGTTIVARKWPTSV